MPPFYSAIVGSPFFESLVADFVLQVVETSFVMSHVRLHQSIASDLGQAIANFWKRYTSMKN